MHRPSRIETRAGPTGPTPALHTIIVAVRGVVARFGLEISGYIAFTAMLALIPFLMFLISLAGFLGETQIGQEFMAALSMFAPPQVMATLEPAIQHIIETRSGSALTIGLLLSLYSAASGVATLRLALNLSYSVTETRPFLWRKLQDLIVVIVGSVVLMLASAMIILGPFLWRLFTGLGLAAFEDQLLWRIGRYCSSLVMILAGVIALHHFLPNARLTLARILPGAITTTLSWVVAASVLTLYFQRDDYTVTYGSLGGVIVTLLFFYITGIIFIFGGELNAALIRRRAAIIETQRTRTKS